MNAVGYDLYCKMLSEAVKEAKGIHTMEDFETTIDLNMDAFIPDSYISNEYQKLDIYKRVAGSRRSRIMTICWKNFWTVLARCQRQ